MRNNKFKKRYFNIFSYRYICNLSKSNINFWNITSYSTSIYIFLLSLLIRLCFLAYVNTNDKHGSAAIFGSAAIGLYNAKGVTTSQNEINSILHSHNVTGNYLTFFNDKKSRERESTFLPGPSFLIFILWKIFPIYNFLSLILFQVLLDSIAIFFFSLVFSNLKYNSGLIISILLCFNYGTIRRVLMVGYDFWPIFTTLITIILLVWSKKNNFSKRSFFMAGIILGVTFWFRELLLLLPFCLVIAIILYLLKTKHSLHFIFIRATCLIFPVVLSLLLITVYRHSTVNDFRPTRSTFWHSFFGGVSQFENPYNLKPNDNDIWNFGRSLSDKLENKTLGSMYQSPKSDYELALKLEAKQFIKNHPNIFIRNILYRISIMISPVLYSNGDLIPEKISQYLIPVGVILFFLFFVGFITIYKTDKFLFILFLFTYLSFIISFSWFYLVGRVILCFLFINLILYYYGIIYFCTAIKNTYFAKLHLTRNKSK